MKGKILLGISLIFVVPISALWDSRYTTVAQWEIAETNWGPICGSSNGLGYWPRSSGQNYIYGCGLWIGGVLPNGDTVVSVGYDPHSATYNSEFTPGRPHTNPSDTLWRVYFSTDDDYPLRRRTMEDGYEVFHDFDTLQHKPDSFHTPEPLGVRIEQHTYVWQKDWADDVVFIKYIVKNDTNYTISNAYLGFCMDFDIGNESGSSSNDRSGCDMARKMLYGWQDHPEPGWTGRGMIGFKLLSPQPMAAFKQFALSNEPLQDRQRYLTLAGYNFQNGTYEPFDTAWTVPDDQRVLISTGPYNLGPGDSVILDWALIASHDSIPPSPDMSMKADRAQRYFDFDSVHIIQVVQPNGGEIISGLYRIEYTAIPASAESLKSDAYYTTESSYDTIAYGSNHTGYFDWVTDSFPDCARGKVGVLVSDTVTFGYDRSDGYFRLNNSANYPPWLQTIAPRNGDTLVRNDTIKWFALDPEFLDSLPISIYYKNQYDTAFAPVVIDHPNDSLYAWNSLAFRNGWGHLIVETHDEEFSAADTVFIYLKNHVSGGSGEHIAGLNNVLNLIPLVHQPENLTGHTYELRFNDYRRGSDTIIYTYPVYGYDLVDSNTGAVLLDDYSLINGYYPHYNYLGINDYAPVIDGFSIWARTFSDTLIAGTQFRNDSVRVVTGAYPEDSISLPWGPISSCWWAYRGSHIYLDWITKPGGGLTLLATDLDYGDTIPYKPYGGTTNADSAYGWCFSALQSTYNPSDTLRAADRYIFLCGDRIRFSRIISPPVPGDRWLVFPHHCSPPIKGNVYRFHPVNYITEHANSLKALSFQIYPVPAVRNLTLAYTLPRSQRVKIVIYDALGRKIKELMDAVQEPGSYRMAWDKTTDHNQKSAAGVYFCRLETGESSITRKLVLLK